MPGTDIVAIAQLASICRSMPGSFTPWISWERNYPTPKTRTADLLRETDFFQDELAEPAFDPATRWQGLRSASGPSSVFGNDAGQLTLARLTGDVGAAAGTPAEQELASEGVLSASKVVGGSFVRRHVSSSSATCTELTGLGCSQHINAGPHCWRLQRVTCADRSFLFSSFLHLPRLLDFIRFLNIMASGAIWILAVKFP